VQDKAKLHRVVFGFERDFRRHSYCSLPISPRRLAFSRDLFLPITQNVVLCLAFNSKYFLFMIKSLKIVTKR
jgi:hypothetical protein